MFRNKRLLSTLTLASSLIAAGACSNAFESLGENAQAITAGIDAGSSLPSTPTSTTTTSTTPISEPTTEGSNDDDYLDESLVIEAATVEAPPSERTTELSETEEVAIWGEPTRGDETMPCYPEGSCDMLFADKVPAPDAPVNDANCNGKEKTISAFFDNRQSANHIQNQREHIYRVTGNIQSSYTEACTNDFIAGLECVNRQSHGSTHKVGVKAWCVKNEHWDPEKNPSKCLPKLEALKAEEYKWGDSGLHKHSGDRSRSSCAWLRGDPDMGAKYCNVMPKSSIDWKPEHTISLRVNGVPVDIVNSWNVGLGGAHAATHAGGGVQIGTFMGYGPAGFFAHVQESPANTWYMAKVENAVVACDDNGNVVETRERSKSIDPIETR